MFCSKKITRIVIGLLVLTLASIAIPTGAESGEAQGMIRVLAIGNSFTHDTFEYLPLLAETAGLDMQFAVLYIGGSTLSQHVKNAQENLPEYDFSCSENGKWINKGKYTIQQALEDGPWDYISLQQQAVLAGVPDTLKDTQKLMDFVSEKCPRAKFIWNMTWAYTDAANDFNVREYFRDHISQYNAIVSATQEVIVPDTRICAVIPTGTAIENARSTILGRRQHTLFRDNIHLSYDYGRKIAAMTFFSALTNCDTETLITFDNDDVRAAALESVKNALAYPFEVTPTAYPADTAKLYNIPTESLYGMFGGWKASNGERFSWLVRGNKGWNYDVILQEDTHFGSVLSLKMIKTDSVELMFSLNMPGNTGINNTGRFQLRVFCDENAFEEGVEIEFAVLSGENCESGFKWIVSAEKLQENEWTKIMLPFTEAELIGDGFDPAYFKELRITSGPIREGTVLQLAEIEFEDVQ